jgi:hypothetical protein
MTVLDAVISLPQIGAPRYSLIGVAGVVTETLDRWISGAQWRPEPLRTEGSGDLGTWKVDAANTAMSGASISPAATGAAFGVWAGEVSSSFDGRWDELLSRVSRKLVAYESREVASQLWSDALGVNPSLKLTGSGAALAGASGGQTIARSIGIADNAIADTWGRGMVHMRPETLAGAVSATVLTKEGNVWMTPLGNIVVADAGYSGLSPAGSGSVGDDFICATPSVEVHRSNVTTLPTELRDGLNRSTNEITLYAMRYVMTVWDYSAGSYYIRATY